MMLYFLFCSLIKCWSFLSSFYGARKVLCAGWRLLTGLPTRARTTSQSTKSSLLNLTKLKRRWETRYSLFASRKKSLSSDRCDDCGRQPVGARRGVLPQVDNAAGLGVSAVNLSPFCHHFVTNLSPLSTFISCNCFGQHGQHGLQGHGNGEVKLGRTSIMEITILNDDGLFEFLRV